MEVIGIVWAVLHENVPLFRRSFSFSSVQERSTASG